MNKRLIEGLIDTADWWLEYSGEYNNEATGHIADVYGPTRAIQWRKMGFSSNDALNSEAQAYLCLLEANFIKTEGMDHDEH